METLVMKFGGASVATPKHFAKIAEIILMRSLAYQKIVVVVSAMGNTTDQLMALAKQVQSNPSGRELDMFISVGERISISLLAMALAEKNKEALSFTGSQTGIITTSQHTEARIIDVRPSRIIPHLNAGKVVIVAGFQGVSQEGEITTLGRGGSDTSAVALGVALKANKVEFYKDVLGIYSDDPKMNPHASLLPFLDYKQAFEIVSKGAKILHSRCILLAEKNCLPLHVLPFEDAERKYNQGTLISANDKMKPDTCFYENELILV